MNKGAFIPALIVMSCVLSSGAALGRMIERWPYDKLFKTADLVILAKATSVRDAPEANKASLPVEFRDIMDGIITRLRVVQVVKGEYMAEQLDLVHFQMKGHSKI